MNDRAAPPPPHEPFESAIDDEVRGGERYQANRQIVLNKLVDLRTIVNETRQGGGPRRVEAQHKKGRLTARERIARLIDEGTEFCELGIHAANGMYGGKAPAASSWSSPTTRPSRPAPSSR